MEEQQEQEQWSVHECVRAYRSSGIVEDELRVHGQNRKTYESKNEVGWSECNDNERRKEPRR